MFHRRGRTVGFTGGPKDGQQDADQHGDDAAAGAVLTGVSFDVIALRRLDCDANAKR